jgi:hypothetical protein
MKYDYETLMNFCKEHNILLCEDYSQKTINAHLIIESKCVNQDCNLSFRKELRSFLNNSYCNDCSKTNAKQKLKTTWLNKYGVDHISKLDQFKNKVKETSLKKYGTVCSLHNNLVNEKTKQTCLEKYGVDCPLKSKEIKDKCKQTLIENYGVEYSSQIKDFKEKNRQTSINKYGAEHYSQTEEFKESYKNTCLEKYGVESYNKTNIFKNKLKETFTFKYGLDSPFKIKEFVEKGKQTCLQKYGSEYYSKTNEFKEKCKATSIKKYGVEHPSQNQHIAEKQSKNAYKSKEYIFPSGRIEKIQGYENFMLNDLLQNNIVEDDIVLGRKNVPEIWFNNLKGKRSRYYVDCFIKSENKCIEVKSEWTVKENDVLLKQQAVKDSGYKCEIWVYNRKGIKIEKYD